MNELCVVGCREGNHHKFCGGYDSNYKMSNGDYISISRKEELIILLPLFINKYGLSEVHKNFLTRKRCSLFAKIMSNDFTLSEISIMLNMSVKSLNDTHTSFLDMDDFKQELISI